MVFYTIKIPGKLPDLNEIIKLSKRSPYAYASQKKKHTRRIANFILAANPQPMSKIDVHCRWIEPNKRRDPDNVASAKKFILDALVLAKVIKNDGWKQIGKLSDEFVVGNDYAVIVTCSENDD